VTIDVFISCANGDLGTVRALESGLTGRGIGAWVYAPGAGDWVPGIREVIHAARTVLIAASQRWKESENCVHELDLARAAHKPVGVVLLEGELPELLCAPDIELIGARVSARTLEAVAAWLARVAVQRAWQTETS
jgi:hypothetical protein